MLEVHHCIAYSGKTEARSFPLVLILGREYNSSGPLIPDIGQYDFTQSRGGSFWNRAYTLIARACPGSGRLKNRCSDLDSSPLVFANVSLRSIPNQLNAKARFEQVFLRLKSPVTCNRCFLYRLLNECKSFCFPSAPCPILLRRFSFR
jgi:hypothetical protein